MNSNNKEALFSYSNSSESMERSSTFLRPITTTSFTSYQEQQPLSMLSSERFVTHEEVGHDIHEHHYDDSTRKMTETELLSLSSSHDNRTKASGVASSSSATMRQNIISKFHQRKLPIRTQIDEYQQWQHQQQDNVAIDDNNSVQFDLYDDSDSSVSDTVSAKEVRDRSRDDNYDDYVEKDGNRLASSVNINKRRGRPNKQGNSLKETKQSQTRPTGAINMENNNKSTFNDDTRTAMKRKQYDESIITGPKKRNKSSSQQQHSSKSANNEETNKSSATMKATKAKNKSVNEKDTTHKLQEQTRHQQYEYLLPGLATKDKDMQSKIRVCAKIAKTLRIQARKNDGKLLIRNIKNAVGTIYSALGYTCNTTEIIQLMKYTCGDDYDGNGDSDHKSSKTNKRSSILHVKKNKKNNGVMITKPKRALSGYNLFFKVERDRLVKSRQQLGITQVQQQQQELQTMNNTIVIGDHSNSFMEPYSIAEIDLAAKASKISKISNNNKDNKGSPSLFGYGELARIIGDKWKKLNEHDRKLFENFASTEQEEYRSERQRCKEQGINHTTTISGVCFNDTSSRHDDHPNQLIPLQKVRKTRKRPNDNPKVVHNGSSQSNIEECHPMTTLNSMPTTAKVEEPSFYQMLLWEQERRSMTRNSSNDMSNKQSNLEPTVCQSSGNIGLVTHENADKYRDRTENKMGSNENKTVELNGDQKQKNGSATHLNNATVRNKDDYEAEGINRKRSKLSPEDIVVEEFLARRAESSTENDDISIGSINTVQSSSRNIGQETGLGVVVDNGTSNSHSWEERGVTSQGKPSELKACESYSCHTNNHRPKISHDLIQPSGITTGPKTDECTSNSFITKQQQHLIVYQ